MDTSVILGQRWQNRNKTQTFSCDEERTLYSICGIGPSALMDSQERDSLLIHASRTHRQISAKSKTTRQSKNSRKYFCSPLQTRQKQKWSWTCQNADWRLQLANLLPLRAQSADNHRGSVEEYSARQQKSLTNSWIVEQELAACLVGPRRLLYFEHQLGWSMLHSGLLVREDDPANRTGAHVTTSKNAGAPA